MTDYIAWAKGLKKAGYATHPEYAEKLINLIERFDLAQYDQASKNRASERLKSQSAETEKKSLSENSLKYVLAETGDTYDIIATEQSLWMWSCWPLTIAKKISSWLRAIWCIWK